MCQGSQPAGQCSRTLAGVACTPWNDSSADRLASPRLQGGAAGHHKRQAGQPPDAAACTQASQPKPDGSGCRTRQHQAQLRVRCCTPVYQQPMQVRRACLLQYCANVSSRVVPPVTAKAALISWRRERRGGERGEEGRSEICAAQWSHASVLSTAALTAVPAQSARCSKQRVRQLPAGPALQQTRVQQRHICPSGAPPTEQKEPDWDLCQCHSSSLAWCSLQHSRTTRSTWCADSWVKDRHSESE